MIAGVGHRRRRRAPPGWVALIAGAWVVAAAVVLIDRITIDTAE